MTQRMARTLAALLLLSASAVSAQDFPGIARGFEPEKSYQIGEIESVNLFSGGLTLTLPIGGSYPIGPSFGLGLTLVYNSHLWRYQEIPNVTTQVLPSEIFNMGLGWTLSLGRLLHPDDPANDGDSYVYYDSSGARHDFYGKLHPSDTGPPDTVFLYTRAGSYLRLVTGSAPVVQLPDGSEQVFERIGTTNPPKYRLQAARDAFNNAYTVGYSTCQDPEDGPLPCWVLSSPSTFNTMEVLFNTTPAMAGDYASKGGVLRRIKLKATGGREALYSFSYQKVTLTPGCESQVSPAASVPFLTQVVLPEGAKWEMPGGVAAYNTTGGGTCNNQLGLLQKLALPTQGRMEWSWGSFLFPQPGACRDFLYNQVGLSQRRHYDRSGVLQGSWSYSQGLDHLSGCNPTTGTNPPHYSTVKVTSPLGDETQHFFSVNTAAVAGRAPLELYGYPVRGVGDQGGERRQPGSGGFDQGLRRDGGECACPQHLRALRVGRGWGDRGRGDPPQPAPGLHQHGLSR